MLAMNKYIFLANTIMCILHVHCMLKFPFNYIYNRCLSVSPLKLWVHGEVHVLDTCDIVCQWIATNCHDITEILMKVALNTITLHHPQTFSLNIFYLLKYAKRIRHKLNKLMKSSPTYNKLQHYLIEHACICIFLTLICVNWRRTENEERN